MQDGQPRARPVPQFLHLQNRRLSRMTSEGPSSSDSWDLGMGCTSGTGQRLLPEPRPSSLTRCTETPGATLPLKGTYSPTPRTPPQEDVSGKPPDHQEREEENINKQRQGTFCSKILRNQKGSSFPDSFTPSLLLSFIPVNQTDGR